MNLFAKKLLGFGLAASTMLASCVDKRPSSDANTKQTEDSIAAVETAQYEAYMVEAAQWDSTEVKTNKNGTVSMTTYHKTENRYIETIFDIEQNEITKTLHDAKKGYQPDTLVSLPLDKFFDAMSGNKQPSTKPVKFRGPVQMPHLQ